MPRFFITESAISRMPDGTVIRITGDDAVHISRVLRMKTGERLVACDMSGCEYDSVIREIGTEVLLDVINTKASENEPPYRAVVYQALVKGDRFDTVIQKATELGVCRIVPMITSRCTVKLDLSDYRKKVERWQRIANEAAKQCGRGSIPVVSEPMRFGDAVNEAANSELSLFCYEGEGTAPIPKILDKVDSPKTVSILIGPEGGYSVDEALSAADAGLTMTGLGKRILRTETAAPFVLACVSYKYEL